jgi:DNA-binding XRE family transcriptional regulator
MTKIVADPIGSEVIISHSGLERHFIPREFKGKKPRAKAYPREVTTIGDAIRERRLDLGLLQKDIAKIIGCDQTSILNWKKGYNKPAMNKMAGVVRFLGAD